MSDYATDYCVCCDKKAVTTVVHILVCEDHYRLYAEEAKQYLPDHQRVEFHKILKAGEEVNRKSRMKNNGGI